MPTQRSAFRTNLTYALNNRTDLGNTRLDQWLNEARLELSTKIRIRQDEVRDTNAVMTTANNRVAIPSAILIPLSIRNTTKDRWLEYMDWTDYHELRVTNGVPARWTTIATTIYFDRLPDAADALEIIGQTPQAWAAGASDVPNVDDQLEYGIHLLAQKHAWLDLGNSARASEIDNPAQMGSGIFWAWMRSNRIPRLLQGMAQRMNPTVRPAVRGYDGLSTF